MAVYLISYDLRAPGRNYDTLYASLKSVPWAHPLESVWLVETDATAARVHDTLKAALDEGDGIMVVEITSSAAWAISGINKPSSDWLMKRRP